MPGFLRESPSSRSHRRQRFCFILSLPLLLLKGPCHARESGGKRRSHYAQAIADTGTDLTVGIGYYQPYAAAPPEPATGPHTSCNNRKQRSSLVAPVLVRLSLHRRCRRLLHLEPDGRAHL